MRVGKHGFTLVELAVVVVIVGVLTAFAVPRFLASMERSRAAEAFNYLSSLQAAQERYHAKQGTYADKIEDLDLKLAAPKYFSVGMVKAGKTGTLLDSWALTLTRSGALASYGAYTITFSEDGYDSTSSTASNYSEINPIQS